MLKGYKILRAILVTIVALPPILAVVLYVLLSLPASQEALRKLAQKELSGILGSELSIGTVNISPFERIDIAEVALKDDFGHKAAYIGNISVGIDIERLIFNRRIVVDFVEIDSLQAHVYRTSPGGELNIARMIDNLRPKTPKKGDTRFDIKINTLVLDDARLRYDVFGTDSLGPGRFDANHIDIMNLNMSANIPSLANEEYDVSLFSFNFTERSGFRLDNLSATVRFTPDIISVADFQIHLPASSISLDDFTITPEALKRLPRIDSRIPLRIAFTDGSYVTPSDLSPFWPPLACLDAPVDLAFGSIVDSEKIQLEQLRLYDTSGALEFSLFGDIDRYYNLDSLKLDFPSLKLRADIPGIVKMLGHCSPSLAGKISRYAAAGTFSFNGKVTGGLFKTSLDASVTTKAGNINIAGSYTKAKGGTSVINGALGLEDFNIGLFFPSSEVGEVTAQADGLLRFSGKYPTGEVVLDVESVKFREYAYSDIHGKVWTSGTQIRAELDVDDPNVYFSSEGFVDINPDFFDMSFTAQLDRFRPDKLNLSDKYPGYTLDGMLDMAFVGDKPEDADGYFRVFDVNFRNNLGDGVGLKEFKLKAASAERPKHIDITSDFVKGSVKGLYTTTAIVPMAKGILSHFLPVLADTATVENLKRIYADSLITNDFEYELTVSPCDNLCKFFNLPVRVIYPINIEGEFHGDRGEALFEAETDWITVGENKLLTDNAVRIHFDAQTDSAAIYATTTFGTKKGPMSVVLESQTANNTMNNIIDWEIQRQNKIFGTIDFQTTLFRDYAGLGAKVHFNPGEITFGNLVWHILPSDIIYSDAVLEVNNFALSTTDESLNISGRVSKDPEDKLKVDLNSVELIDIFETLDIDKALIGGRATGSVVGSSLLSGMPIATAERLSVKDISYNYCPLGDAEVRASWDQDRLAFGLNAEISQTNGHASRIFGDIYAGRDSLDINFTTDRVNIGFLKPFMSAFASEVGGMASGRAHLFGTFKDVDLEGNLFADSITIKLAYTNTAYTVRGDSLHIRPGIIDIQPVTLYDVYGNTAKFTGWLRHNFFHDPSFNFEVYDADKLLCYDITPRLSERWYGKIFGNSNSRHTTITGIPPSGKNRGEVRINVQMATAGQSGFTFALLDREMAGVYDFLTFHDITVVPYDSLIDIDNTPEAVKEINRRMEKRQQEESSKVIFNMSVEINPNTKMTLIMDPVSGDSIVATGSGRLDMTYDSVNDDITMKGSYTIERGHYDVSVQDIIHKNFVINSGSKVTFNGDPYNAILDITAKYVTQASLSDLDESFNLDGKGSQSIPVHAIVIVKGSIQSPVVTFDLEYPTLKEETKRKINSIINTPEILQRQVAYLISMGRFYTPDYMSGTRGNELVSVASATLSSQISSMLGQLSDKWRIAPSVRSDRGDFSDVEVDVSLSSNLLNNRLIFNGNFGYRDKSLNVNQFVGDFDIEYLLNPRGSWRLKAYNRYNDQNYYLRSAATTQGIGIVYQKDFDNMFSFFRRRNRKKADNGKKREEADSVVIKETVEIEE